MKCAVALAMSRASDTYVNLKISLGISWRVQPQLLLLLFCYHDQVVGRVLAADESDSSLEPSYSRIRNNDVIHACVQ